MLAPQRPLCAQHRACKIQLPSTLWIQLPAHVKDDLRRGAALFGDNPRLVAGRISALAYGTDYCLAYRPGMRGDTFVADGRRM